jgi:hypothetical protein
MRRNAFDTEGARNNPQPVSEQHTPTPRISRVALIAIVVAATGFAVAACSNGASTPQVASLGGSDGTKSGVGHTTTTATKGNNPIRLLDKWAACMRAHGDPGQADPTVDANKVIHLTWNDAVPGGVYGTNKGGQGSAGPGQYCRTYIDEAQTDLQGGQQPQQPSQTQMLEFSQCMRANGIPNFPDPSNGGLTFNVGAGGDLNPSNPIFKNASTLCAQKAGVPGFAAGVPQPGSIAFNGADTGGAGG